MRLPARLLAALLFTVGTTAAHAHHSLAGYDVSAPLWIRGTVQRFERVNPHSLILLDEPLATGGTRRWIIDGPPPMRLQRLGVTETMLKVGDVITVCGFPPRDGAIVERNLPGDRSLTGLVLNGHLLLLADGRQQTWSDYGLLEKCLPKEGAK